jgi:drug/metabolite transporter (DMT)-like permease
LNVNRSSVLGAGFVLIWSNGYVVGSIASHAAPALAITFWRPVIAGLLLAGLAVAHGGQWPRGRRAIGGIALLGALLFGVQFGGVYLGIAQGMPAGTSALLISTCPLIVAIVQVLIGAERLTRRQWLGAGLGLVGVVVALLERLDAPGSIAPLLWTVLGLAGFAAATVLTPRLVPAGVDPRAVTSIECLIASAVVGLAALTHGGVAVPMTGPAIGSGSWLTLINGVGAPLVILALVQQRGATRASSLLFVVPAVTAVASWPVLGEPIGVPTIAGLVIAAVGIALVQRGPRPAGPGPTLAPRYPPASTMRA